MSNSQGYLSQRRGGGAVIGQPPLSGQDGLDLCVLLRPQDLVELFAVLEARQGDPKGLDLEGQLQDLGDNLLLLPRVDKGGEVDVEQPPDAIQRGGDRFDPRDGQDLQDDCRQRREAHGGEVEAAGDAFIVLLLVHQELRHPGKEGRRRQADVNMRYSRCDLLRY